MSQDERNSKQLGLFDEVMVRGTVVPGLAIRQENKTSFQNVTLDLFSGFLTFDRKLA